MVTETPLTRKERQEIDRQQRVERALAAGDHEFAEWIRTEMQYDDESTPEEDAEDARISAERLAEGKFITLEEIEQRDAKENPEEAAFFRRLDEEFPGWEFYLGKAPSHSAESAEFYRRLGAEFQEALELFNDFLR